MFVFLNLFFFSQFSFYAPELNFMILLWFFDVFRWCFRNVSEFHFWFDFSDFFVRKDVWLIFEWFSDLNFYQVLMVALVVKLGFWGPFLVTQKDSNSTETEHETSRARARARAFFYIPSTKVQGTATMWKQTQSSVCFRP